MPVPYRLYQPLAYRGPEASAESGLSDDVLVYLGEPKPGLLRVGSSKGELEVEARLLVPEAYETAEEEATSRRLAAQQLASDFFPPKAFSYSLDGGSIYAKLCLSCQSFVYIGGLAAHVETLHLPPTLG